MPSLAAKKRYYEKNKPAILANMARIRAERRKDPEAVLAWHIYLRERMLKQRYGLTSAQYSEMLSAQGGGCAICTRKSPGNGHGDRYFDVDHCHETDKVRGLLCRQCNLLLGQLEKLKRPGMRSAIAKYLGYDPK